MNFRIVGATTLLIFLSGCMAYIFWHQELKYSLPTPVPLNYTALKAGQTIESSLLHAYKNNSLYLHFYNPDCPCSRFNAKQVRDIIRAHGDSISALVVVPFPSYINSAKKEFGDHLEIISDSNGQLAKSCGVYSTPQAVIIDSSGNLFYRGNYNRARYCTAQATNYAELALLSLLNGAAPPVFDQLATQSYGCQLPPALHSSIQF